MRKDLNVSKQSDIQGFNSFKCSLCSEEFKLKTHNVNEADTLEIFCPSCGIPNSISTYVTDDVLEQFETLAANEAHNILNNMFKEIEKSTRGSQNMTFKIDKQLPTRLPKTVYEKDDLEKVLFLCCEREVKLSLLTRATNPFCPYCGVN